jgi:hypothetical protein
MKKILFLFALLFVYGSSSSFSQSPVSPNPLQEENKVVDFKILTPEEASKINDENQKKAEEAKKLASIEEYKSKVASEKEAKKLKNQGKGGKTLLTFFGVGIIGLLTYTTILANSI